MNDITIGFDPGGEDHFGWVVLKWAAGKTPDVLGKGNESNAKDAFEKASSVLENTAFQPLAVGVDAPLFWHKTGENRSADDKIRELIEENPASTVLRVNSLWGACLAQGILVARMVLDKWENAVLTEAHPKALMKLKGQDQIIDFYHQMEQMIGPREDNDHKLDAALAAYSAWMGYNNQQSGWHDLMEQERDTRFCPWFSSLDENRVHYWFPPNTRRE